MSISEAIDVLSADLEVIIVLKHHVKVAHDLLIASAKGLMSVLVLFNLSAAFDTVDHHIFKSGKITWDKRLHLKLAYIRPVSVWPS